MVLVGEARVSKQVAGAGIVEDLDRRIGGTDLVDKGVDPFLPAPESRRCPTSGGSARHLLLPVRSRSSALRRFDPHRVGVNPQFLEWRVGSTRESWKAGTERLKRAPPS